MIEFFRKKERTEKRFRKFLKTLEVPIPIWALFTCVFTFPAKKYFPNEEDREDLFLELSLFCLFILDLWAVKKRIPAPSRETILKECSDSLFQFWKKDEFSEVAFYTVVNDRLAFYGNCVSSPEGWRVVEMSINLLRSAAGGISMKWDRNSGWLPTDHPKWMEFTEDFGHWGSVLHEVSDPIISDWLLKFRDFDR